MYVCVCVVGCVKSVTTTNDDGVVYNLGRWHEVIVRRRANQATVHIDNNAANGQTHTQLLS